MKWFELTVPSDNPNSDFSVAKTARIARCMRLSKLWKAFQLIKQAVESANSFVLRNAFELTTFISFMIAWCHMNACLWYWVGKGSWVDHIAVDKDSALDKLAVSASFVLAQMQGSTVVVPGPTRRERLFHLLLTSGSILILGVFTSKLTNSILDTATRQQAAMRQIETAMEYLAANRISTALASTVKQHVRHQKALLGKKVEAEEAMLSSLPASVRRALIKEARAPNMFGHVVWHAFNSIGSRYFESVCVDLFQEHYYNTDALVFSITELANHVFLLHRGKCFFTHGTESDNTVEAVRPDLMRNEIVPGDMMSEAALWCYWHHVGDLTVTHNAVILQLLISDFSGLVKRYPVIKRASSMYAHDFVIELNENIQHTSDLFDSKLFLDLRQSRERFSLHTYSN